MATGHDDGARGIIGIKRAAGLAGLVALACVMGCAAEFEVDEPDEDVALSPEPLASTGVNADTRDVQDMVWGACSTTSVKGLSQQLIEEVNCLEPGTMKRMPESSNLVMSRAVFPFLQAGAADALGRALDRRSSPMYMTSALRTTVQQYLLYQWYRNRRCGIGLAARPGTSNHESGLAVDMSNYGTWRSTMGSSSFRWFGGGDPVHFDYTGPSRDLRRLSVLAFQRLWNRNNPGDPIGEDGDYGPATEARLKRAPAIGFARGASCGDSMTPATRYSPIEVYWYRNPDGSYKLRALTSSSVERVEYKVDEWTIGSASRDDGANFPASYTFSSEQRERLFQVLGFDADGTQVALGVGLIDVTPEWGVSVRQVGQNTYRVAMERAPQGVAYIEVEADGWPVGSSEGEDRLEVQHTFSELGERTFAIHTYNADGTRRGTLRRTFTLR